MGIVKVIWYNDVDKNCMYCYFDVILIKFRMFMLNSGEEYVGYGLMEMEMYFVKLN